MMEGIVGMMDPLIDGRMGPSTERALDGEGIYPVCMVV